MYLSGRKTYFAIVYVLNGEAIFGFSGRFFVTALSAAIVVFVVAVVIVVCRLRQKYGA